MNSTRAGKDQLYEQLSQIGKAVASAARLEILELLCQGEKSVEALALEVGQKMANTSAHLRALRSSRLVETRREGQFIYYRVADPEICSLLLSLRRLGERRLGEVRDTVEAFFRDPDGLEPIDRSELLARVHRGEVVLIDVRPEEEYRAGHLPGALSVPPDELPRRIEALPRDRRIIAYCRGPYCMFSRRAVELLRSRGYDAARLDEGVIEWRAEGLPLEIGGDRAA